ncbi:MAG: hypothetical protein SH809_11820 [Rhodothermales bacterium]|nr:hypothetical protein [Rhodothermales bacterium]
MLALKPLSKSSIPAALDKAKQYRLLNEPRLAESICQDILAVEPENHDAIVILLLAITDQFASGAGSNKERARALLERMPNEYERQYYAGIVWERIAKAAIDKELPDFIHLAYEWLREAMTCYERAETIRPEGNDDAILRWNTCVRLIERYRLEASQEEASASYLE